ncbi:uncharacterized protein LAESUDRAFT_737368 [Laetiporus sulphureus 93-53]|uniref:Uncharacterized protein n=1 Tax=Laetiporus sulphureus 93-53 TaxID=1314785 RepID=A0A165DWW6_9APHY|nr:uncharacterized protein LAESUDRAFT_737368 [Laetiporus sulphureus 93-53]KZT05795.1 hypothetical protein LAESUDRAFT_737368 [Laetiporus sulphureus 93-53]
MGNMAFQGHMSYAPERVTHNGMQEYSEMCTGAVVASMILASDKIQLSVFGNDKMACNIDKVTRHQPLAHATTLLGYISVPKLKCFEEKTRSNVQYQLFHHCMSKAGQQGMQMLCADGHIHVVFLILAAYIANYPEQCLIVCCKENHCPCCIVDPKARGEPCASTPRSYGDEDQCVETEGLRPVYSLFWADLPHTNIFAYFLSDILHQLHKGIFKDHFVTWCTALLGKKDLDHCFQAMSEHAHLCYFKDGISGVSQWTEKEQKKMQKVFMELLTDAIDKCTVHVLHSELSLTHMKQDAFIEADIQKHFNIPKLHVLVHYIDAIHSLGTLDGFNTETSECLHIDYAKKAYQVTNRKEYISQMTTWLQRQEALVRQDAYLHWVDKVKNDLDVIEKSEYHDAEDDDEEDDNVQAAEDAEEGYRALCQLMNSNIKCTYQLPKQLIFCWVSVDDISTHFEAGHRKPIPAHFDTVLIVLDRETYHECEGLQAAQVCLIFSVPQHLACTNDVLAYIYWFRPFRAKHAESGYYVTEHSTGIINVNSISRSCHLIPEFRDGPVDPAWTPSDMLSRHVQFHLNSHIDFFMFELCEGMVGSR